MADSDNDGLTHASGVVMVLGSALVFSLTGPLTKLIETDAWTIVCWRGFVGGIIITFYVLWRRQDQPSAAPLRLGWRGWVLAGVGSLASIAFIFAFKLTYIANVVIIYATVPFVAAFLEWQALREPFGRATMVAAFVSLAGVAIMVCSGVGAGNFAGDAVAVLMTFGNALYMVLIRVFRNTPVVFAGAASSFQLFVLGWLVTDPLAVSRHDVLLLTLFGVGFALALVLWTEGTRRIPAAESGLLGAADVPLAVLFAWIILAELPPVASFVGGGVVLAAVLGHTMRDFVPKNPN